MKKLLQPLLIALATLQLAPYAQAKPQPATPAWAGDWQWKDPHDSEFNHYLRLKGPATKPTGDYVGNETAEGVVFFKVAVSNLKITPQNRISFEVGPHGLTRERLKLTSKNKPIIPVMPEGEGVSYVRFKFEGQLKGKVLVLKCQSDDNNESCPPNSSSMQFQRMR